MFTCYLNADKKEEREKEKEIWKEGSDSNVMEEWILEVVGY